MTDTVEGSLGIHWTNFHDLKAQPQYNLLFSRYKRFQNGAQQPFLLVGTPALENYLRRLGFADQNVLEWMTKTHKEHGVSIPNVVLSEEYLADYGLSV